MFIYHISANLDFVVLCLVKFKWIHLTASGFLNQPSSRISRSFLSHNIKIVPINNNNNNNKANFLVCNAMSMTPPAS